MGEGWCDRFRLLAALTAARQAYACQGAMGEERAMPTLPILAIGIDAEWRARLRRLFGSRCEVDWQGAYAPAEPRRRDSITPTVLLLDGDDSRSERAPRRQMLAAPRRLYFYRRPTVDALHHCVDVGAHGCLQKRAGADMILRAVRGVESDLFVVAPGLLKEALGFHDGVETLELPGAAGAELTERQREVLQWAARGMSNKEIARQLQISPETVKTHLHNMYEREGVHGRMALVAACTHEQTGGAGGRGSTDAGPQPGGPSGQPDDGQADDPSEPR
jgi:DNA-binding CsgD family transcriptional regulator